MKTMKFILIGIIISIMIPSCDKEPTANFTTEKDTCYAGQSIHLTNTSINAESWKWTMPNGQVITTNNIDYLVDSMDLGGTSKTFTLEVKNGSKTSSIAKSVYVSQPIYSSDFYSYDSLSFKPDIKYSLQLTPGTSNWSMIAYKHAVLPCLILEFYGHNPPAIAGTYTLRDTIPNAPFQARAEIYMSNNVDLFHYVVALSGQMNLNVTSDGKMHAVFTNVSSQENRGTFQYTATMSADITFR